jgi:hypothetical protein
MKNLYLLKRYWYCKFKKKIIIYILIFELNKLFSTNFCKYYVPLLVIISEKNKKIKIKFVF